MCPFLRTYLLQFAWCWPLFRLACSLSLNSAEKMTFWVIDPFGVSFWAIYCLRCTVIDMAVDQFEERPSSILGAGSRSLFSR